MGTQPKTTAEIARAIEGLTSLSTELTSLLDSSPLGAFFEQSYRHILEQDIIHMAAFNNASIKLEKDLIVNQSTFQMDSSSLDSITKDLHKLLELKRLSGLIAVTGLSAYADEIMSAMISKNFGPTTGVDRTKQVRNTALLDVLNGLTEIKNSLTTTSVAAADIESEAVIDKTPSN